MKTNEVNQGYSSRDKMGDIRLDWIVGLNKEFIRYIQSDLEGRKVPISKQADMKRGIMIAIHCIWSLGKCFNKDCYNVTIPISDAVMSEILGAERWGDVCEWLRDASMIAKTSAIMERPGKTAEGLCDRYSLEGGLIATTHQIYSIYEDSETFDAMRVEFRKASWNSDLLCMNRKQAEELLEFANNCQERCYE